jgi:glutamyl-Q tRNA(Asp) synthetase
LPPVAYLHLPLVTEPDGAKLSKSRRALPAGPDGAGTLMSWLLGALGIDLPADLRSAPVAEQLAWAVPAWEPQRLRGIHRVAPPPRPGLPGTPAGV